MDRKRAAIMEKARAKRSRREAAHREKVAAESSAADKSEGLSEQLLDLTQETLGKVGAAVKQTARTIKKKVIGETTAQRRAV